MVDYCNDLWPLVYDQYNHGRHEQELAFYTRELAPCTGPILEVACGTGMILWEFELLARLSGFRVAALYSDFEGQPYHGDGEMVWVLGKETTPP
jgi:hypothetical protein